jgi:two-component sensor histidine kinase
MAIMAAPRIEKRVRADAEQVPRLRAAVAAFTRDHCDHSDETAQVVALAVTEACSNAVRHAYPGSSGELTLTGRVDGDQLTLTVVDEGVGLVTETRPAAGRLGLRLMRELATTTITSDQHGTRVHLRFPRTTATQPSR